MSHEIRLASRWTAARNARQLPSSLSRRVAALRGCRFAVAHATVWLFGGQGGASATNWPPVVAETIAETCAVRGLALRRPLRVRPMAAFEGGYTPGIGSVVWQADDAEVWRQGWCTLGVYCAPPPGEAASGNDRSEVGLAGPRGLYDAERATLFVAADGDAVPAATIAHEATHALQHQNYPQLAAIHLWHNRDLAAAANAALEGDAHVLGWAFDPAWRLSVCSNSHQALANLGPRWGWRPDGYWAHEGFPHVFGPALALERQLAKGNAGVDELVQAPPLATRNVLAPGADAGVTFIDLTADLDGDALSLRGCKAGLANTAGALGIWGLLLQHGAEGVNTEEMPKFLGEWLGDRFVHVACADESGEPSGELAWLTLWASDDAAGEFAASYRQVAAAATEFGDVLASVPTATRLGAQVLVVTAGLRTQQSRLFAAPRETFHSYREWTAANCFPQAHCDTLPTSAETNASLLCDGAPPSSRLADWIGRIRQARGALVPAAGERGLLGTKAGELATFCVRNSIGNGDMALACRAVVTGIRHWRGWQADANWRLLPHCASKGELKEWLRDGYYADVARPFAAAESFAGIYGPPLVAEAFAQGSMDALRELMANPPLSTRALLGLPPAPVAFARLPDAALAAADCTVSATDVRGPFAIWTLLLDHGDQFPAETPPPLLAAWRGDQQLHLRCRSEGWAEGWLWATRWQSERAAKQFAGAYRALDSSVVETGLPHEPTTRLGRVVLAAPPALEEPALQLARALVWQEYGGWAQWIEAGCPPQEACRGAPPRP